jgi:hypothetical protein
MTPSRKQKNQSWQYKEHCEMHQEHTGFVASLHSHNIGRYGKLFDSRAMQSFVLASAQILNATVT